MIDSLYIAWKYIVFNRIKTVILVTCITLIAVLPLVLQVLLQESERQLQSRATTTPLLLGAKGSALDLVMNSLYFDDEVPELISMQAEKALDETGLAVPIPLYIRFHARGFPIVGTSLDYFDFRQLSIVQGRMFAILGECVLGAEVAEHIGLGPGDSLVSSPENLFDIAGVYPLKMNIAGVLARSHTADDRAIFVDTKTAWVIQGLGHGHEDLTQTRDSSVILSREEGKVTANAKLMQFTEITEDNLDAFHFHGEAKSYPLTAVIISPKDAKSGTILQGRYLNHATEQIVRPKDVIDGLLDNIFRVKNLLDIVILVVGIATVLAIVLVFSLSLRLRQREIDTIFKLGCSRLTVARMIGAEILLIGLVSALLCVAIVFMVSQFSDEIVRGLLFRVVD